MDKIQLSNRYNEDNYLERIEGDKWKLCLGNPKDYDHTRLGLRGDDGPGYYFVDPPGGPFISIDSKIAGKTVYKITYDENKEFCIYLKEGEND